MKSWCARDDDLAVCGEIGISPLAVVSIVGLFTGMILAFQVGMELDRFGQAETVSNMMGVILFREMGPFMTAMILTASVGSAMTRSLWSGWRLRISTALAVIFVVVS